MGIKLKKRGNRGNKKVVEKKQKSTKKLPAFLNFKKNKFTKLARDYHNELFYLTNDLVSTNRRIQDATALCGQQINFLKRGSFHLITIERPVCFDDALYHLENFDFRVTGYRDKIVQFINQALRVGFDEKQMGVISAIVSNGTVRDAHLDTEIKKFNKDKDFKSALSERILLTHRRYYNSEAGYDRLMRPNKTTKSAEDDLKLWKQNIKTKANRANRIVEKSIEMNDRIMGKINDYLKRNPIR